MVFLAFFPSISSNREVFHHVSSMFRFFPTCFSQPFLPNPCTLRGLRGAGGTFFMLDQLQPDAEALWAGAPAGSVVACDFYNAGALLPLNDEAGWDDLETGHTSWTLCVLLRLYVCWLPQVSVRKHIHTIFVG